MEQFIPSSPYVDSRSTLSNWLLNSQLENGSDKCMTRPQKCTLSQSEQLYHSCHENKNYVAPYMYVAVVNAKEGMITFIPLQP